MERLIERFVCSNTRCYSCGGLVYAVEKKKTTNHIYHNRCFRCRICKRNLTESTLNEEGDDIYCTNCYRKKQRGDCNSLDFKRAADERAQYVYNRRHPDQSSPKPNPRPPIQRNLSQHPSWTLRQLERQFLSHQESNTKDSQKLNENYQRITSGSHPVAIKTSFSVPSNLKNYRPNSLLIKSNSSSSTPPLQFFPVFSFSPLPNSKPESIATTPKTPKTPKTPPQFNGVNITKINSSNSIQSQTSKNSNKSTDGTTPSTAYKVIRIAGLNQKNENTTKNQNLFHFPDTHTTLDRHRSSSVSYSINPYKIK